MTATPASYATDLLHRDRFAGKLERFIATEHHFVDGALVVTLNAPFGAGKTTFVQMWAADIRERRKSDTKLPRPVILNAWESDWCGDPLIAVLAALKEALIDPDSPDPAPQLADKLTNALKDVGWFAISAAGGVASRATGIDATKAGEFAKAKQAERRDAPDLFHQDLLEAYGQRRAAVANIKGALKGAFAGDDPCALVIIDELDRCRPDYAVSYLEAIKHIFDVHGIAFVLCVDEQQLSSAVSVLFGGGLRFDEYYRKFSHRTVRLPEPTRDEMGEMTMVFVRRCLAKEGKRVTAMEDGRNPLDNLPQIFAALEMQPRQAQEACRIIGHAFAKPSVTDNRGVNWLWAVDMMLMAALRVTSRSTYTRLANPDAKPRDAADVTVQVFGKDRNQGWWFEVLVSSLRRDETWEAEAADQVKQLKMVKDDEQPDIRRMLSDFLRMNHSDSSLLTDVAARIENITTFSER